MLERLGPWKQRSSECLSLVITEAASVGAAQHQLVPFLAFPSSKRLKVTYLQMVVFSPFGLHKSPV